jgi:nitrate/TMAO reductase-like tetraheme cytochrome c subunit
MKRPGIVLGTLVGLLVTLAIVVSGTAEAQPPLQTGEDESCITCHTSQETLQELAVEPEEEGEALSEGEG